MCNLNRLPNLASYNNYEIKIIIIEAYYTSYKLTNYLRNNIVNISRCVNYDFDLFSAGSILWPSYKNGQ